MKAHTRVVFIIEVICIKATLHHPAESDGEINKRIAPKFFSNSIFNEFCIFSEKVFLFSFTYIEYFRTFRLSKLPYSRRFQGRRARRPVRMSASDNLDEHFLEGQEISNNSNQIYSHNRRLPISAGRYRRGVRTTRTDDHNSMENRGPQQFAFHEVNLARGDSVEENEQSSRSSSDLFEDGNEQPPPPSTPPPPPPPPSTPPIQPSTAAADNQNVTPVSSRSVAQAEGNQAPDLEQNLHINQNIPAESQREFVEVVEQPSASIEAAGVIVLDSPSPAKKRKRTSGTPKNEKTSKLNATSVEGDSDENEDDGCTCPICFDNWEMSGDHRLVALRCGHLFGDSCIRRWLAECGRQSGVKMCPQCKTKATPRDIRCLYAKRVRAIDRTEEHELRRTLEEDRSRLKSVEIELSTLRVTHALSLKKIKEQETEIEHLKLSLRNRPAGALGSAEASCSDHTTSYKNYKFFMEHNITITRENGCRVMAFTKKHASLLVSQKSVNSLFPGFGISLIDVSTFQTMQFLHLTNKMIRDISVSSDEQIIACTSMEPTARLYDFRMRASVSIGTPAGDRNLWACAMGDVSNNWLLYGGTQQGSTLTFDTRFPSTVVTEYETVGDLSPVISIVVIPRNDDFPLGGICVCKLQSVWFYEFTSESLGSATATRLFVEGPFMSMNFEPTQSMLIITARISQRYLESRFIIGKLIKFELRAHLEIKATMLGSKMTPVMTRNCQVAVEGNSLLAAYLQDTKQMAIFDIRRQQRVQSLPVNDIIYDTCPVYTTKDTYLAALTENKCRIYKLNES